MSVLSRRFFIGFSTPAPVDVDHDAYILACGRVMTDVMGVVRARGFAVSVHIDPGRAPLQAIIDTHKIHLTYRGVTCVLTVDHDTFMNAEFFRTLVLHQIESAINELAAEG